MHLDRRDEPSISILRRLTGVGFSYHYALIVQGSVLFVEGVLQRSPMIVELMREGLVVRPLLRGERWGRQESITDQIGALERLQRALDCGMYDLLTNNCEHFVNYVRNGKKESKQVRIGFLAVLGAGLFCFSK